jgi:hypothetical protein
VFFFNKDAGGGAAWPPQHSLCEIVAFVRLVFDENKI